MRMIFVFVINFFGGEFVAHEFLFWVMNVFWRMNLLGDLLEDECFGVVSSWFLVASSWVWWFHHGFCGFILVLVCFIIVFDGFIMVLAVSSQPR